MPPVTSDQRRTARLLQREKSASPLLTLRDPESGYLVMGWLGSSFLIKPDGTRVEMERIVVE